MLGKRIEELRKKLSWSQRKLAKESNLPHNRLAKIEQGVVENLSPLTLIRIADALHICQDEFIYLMKLEHGGRRFQAYSIGIAKTGTRSIAGIFRNYYSKHEFMFRETSKIVMKFDKGKITKEEFRKYVRKRDNKGLLEMDSASFNYFYLDILAEEFPSAKFIFTIRDCYSWLDSLINMFLSGKVGNKRTPWIFDWAKFLFGMDSSLHKNKKCLLRCFDGLIDRVLAYWSLTNRKIIHKLPPGRSLIIRTADISNSIEKMADFIGVPRETLLRENSHLFKAVRKFNVLHEIDYKFLNKKFKYYCSSLMEEFFPGYTFEDFLICKQLK